MAHFVVEVRDLGWLIRVIEADNVSKAKEQARKIFGAVSGSLSFRVILAVKSGSGSLESDLTDQKVPPRPCFDRGLYSHASQDRPPHITHYLKS